MNLFLAIGCFFSFSFTASARSSSSALISSSALEELLLLGDQGHLYLDVPEAVFLLDSGSPPPRWCQATRYPAEQLLRLAGDGPPDILDQRLLLAGQGHLRLADASFYARGIMGMVRYPAEQLLRLSGQVHLRLSDAGLPDTLEQRLRLAGQGHLRLADALLLPVELCC